MIAQMGYIVCSQFLQEYELGLHSGLSVYDFHSTYVDSDGNSLTALNISFDQLLADRTALFGAIVGISHYQVATEIVHRYANTNDGIAAFIALLE